MRTTEARLPVSGPLDLSGRAHVRAVAFQCDVDGGEEVSQKRAVVRVCKRDRVGSAIPTRQASCADRCRSSHRCGSGRERNGRADRPSADSGAGE